MSTSPSPPKKLAVNALRRRHRITREKAERQALLLSIDPLASAPACEEQRAAYFMYDNEYADRVAAPLLGGIIEHHPLASTGWVRDSVEPEPSRQAPGELLTARNEQRIVARHIAHPLREVDDTIHDLVGRPRQSDETPYVGAFAPNLNAAGLVGGASLLRHRAAERPLGRHWFRRDALGMRSRVAVALDVPGSACHG